jgi:hypothetical protein
MGCTPTMDRRSLVQGAKFYELPLQIWDDVHRNLDWDRVFISANQKNTTYGW